MVLAEDLRKSVLQEALQGKLTEQLVTDSSVDELIVDIRKEKIELIKRKNARLDKAYDDIQEKDKEFEIPESWRWIRIGEIGVYKKGPFGSALTKSLFVKKSENTIKVYEQKNAIQKDHTLGTYYITKEYYESSMSGFKVEAGDIIVSCAGTIGETYVMPKGIELGIINQALMRMNIAPSINQKYFLYYFDHILKKNAQKNSNGSAIKNIPPFDVFKNMLLPLPPVEEQQRIVDKLDLLMKEIDEYAVMENELEMIKKSFPEDFERAVMQYAMQGKLTKQLSDDSDVNLYIDEITDIKKQLVKDKKYANKKKSNVITYSDELFDIPDSWSWIRFGELVDFKLGKTPERQETKYWKNGKYKWVSIADMPSNGHLKDTKEYVSEVAKEEKFGDISPAGTLIMSFKLTVGKVSILDCEAFHNEAIISIFPLKDEDDIVRDYLFKILPYVTKYGDKKNAIKGATLNSTSLANLMIPLPPLEEQRRIVDKLDQLLPLVEDIKKL